jgi:tetratricopeptide (TPR) repeat protein
MGSRIMKYAVIVGLLALSTPAFAQRGKPEPDDLPGPQPEVAPAQSKSAKVDLPEIPGFELPATEPGFHSPRELRVRGKPMLGTEIKVKGYITWIYDCVAVLASSNPQATRPQIQAAIVKDPSLCERPKFYVGDARTTPRESSIWVVDVPRPQTKQAPKLALGDYVAVTGTWALQSPSSEHNTDGLLVYKALAPATPSTAAPAPPSPPAAEPEITVAKPAIRKPVADKVRASSIERLTACTKSFAARQYDAAIPECEAATKLWDGNHLAWYTQGSSHMARGEWTQARDAVERAAKIRPDQGMYQLYHGISLYEAEHQRAREELAKKDNKKPAEVAVNPALLKLDDARDALLRAAKIAPDLWRAHYYLGKLYRDRDDARRAAEQFALTIKTHPSYRYGYIALIELYRRWEYNDQALAVALAGTVNVPASEVNELWFEVGMVHDAKRGSGKAADDKADEKAIEAFGKAIAAKPDDAGSKFQRGQIYFRKGNFVAAKADLEDVVASTDPRIAGTKPIARQILSQIANKKR